MDRDKRHERIKLAYEGLVQGIGDKVEPANLATFVKEQYESGVTDEFLKPIIVNDQGLIGDGDTLLFFDFRADRMRQINEAFGIQRHFETDVVPKDISITTLTKYKEEFPFPVLFPPRSNEDTLAEWLSKKEVDHLHVAGWWRVNGCELLVNGILILSCIELLQPSQLYRTEIGETNIVQLLC